MEPKTAFTCANVLKCTNTIAASALNDIQLKAIRQLPRTCDVCKVTSRWIEQQALFTFTPIPTQKKRNGGRGHGKNTNTDRHIH